VVISCRRFGTKFRSHFQSSLDSWRWEPIGCSETSIKNYHYSLRNDREKRSSRLHYVRVFIFATCFDRNESSSGNKLF
jgi:hypothetical protein